MDYRRLDDLMLKRMVTNSKLGQFVGTTDTIVGRWRRGEAIPKSDKLAKIAECLDCSVDYLLGLSDAVNQDSPEPLPAEEEKLLARFRGLDDDGREEVLHTALVELRRVNAERGEGEASAEA